MQCDNNYLFWWVQSIKAWSRVLGGIEFLALDEITPESTILYLVNARRKFYCLRKVQVLLLPETMEENRC